MSESKPKWAWSSVDDPNPIYPKCDRCTAFARWAVACLEDEDSIEMFAPTTRWFACGRHLNSVLDSDGWILDAVVIYDITHPPERG